MSTAVASEKENGNQLFPDGLELSLKTDDGQAIEIGPDGQIEWLEDFEPQKGWTPKSVTLELVVKPRFRFVAIMVDGQKNVVAKRPESTKQDQRFRYLLTVRIEREGDKRFTRAPQNQIRVIKFRPNGIVEQWTISIVAQENSFWVVAQRVYEIPCYRDEQGVLVMVGWRTWPQMTKFLTEQFGKDGISKLPPVPQELPPIDFGVELPQDIKLDENQAWVGYFDESCGLGNVVVQDGFKYSVHWTQVPPRTDLDTERRLLKKGEIVTVGGTRPPSGKGRYDEATNIGVGGLAPMPVFD